MMPYVDRDVEGHIKALYANAQYGGHEFAEVAELYVPPPTKEQVIESMLAVSGKDRLLIQTVITVVEAQAPALAAQYGVTLAVALATIYAKNKSYRVCKDLEAAIRVVETAP